MSEIAMLHQLSRRRFVKQGASRKQPVQRINFFAALIAKHQRGVVRRQTIPPEPADLISSQIDAYTVALLRAQPFVQPAGYPILRIARTPTVLNESALCSASRFVKSWVMKAARYTSTKACLAISSSDFFQT